jgi:16S rRNA G966 N2-methylase RsmD
MDEGTQYPGGKGGAGVYQTIINQMPVHTTYLEPFLGGGAIMALKRPAQWNIGIDLDAEAVRQARSRIVRSDEDRSCIAIADDAAESRGLTMQPGTVGGGGHQRWYFWADDGLAFLQSYPFCGDELVYADPPYLERVAEFL